ncbi:hypothetical protein V5799_007154 [Amblyomma americanum]|uniref:BHLH domain-containing protein n=1 Tax=Amblyomma americanum TaxID=6943 RepID=A0AAQ4DUC4_AMBAM
MEDFLNLDFDTADCSWKLWEGIEEEPCYFDGLLELDLASDLGLSTSSSDDASLGLSPLLEVPPVPTSDCCEQLLQGALPDSSTDAEAREAALLSVADCNAPSAARSQAKATSRNAARERSRVRSLRSAFQALQGSLPAVPPDTKLSKLDILVLASNYIAHLGALLSDDEQQTHGDEGGTSSPDDSPGRELDASNSRSYLHPVKKWPMRSRLYAGTKPYADGRPRRQASDLLQAKRPSRNSWKRLESSSRAQYGYDE